MHRPAFRLMPLCLLAFGFCINVGFGQRHETGILGEGHSWQTPYHINDSGADGPTVVITGGIHGNEPAGFRAAEQIRHWPIVRGKLIVVPRVNRFGLDQNIRFIPNADAEQQDLNRNFPIRPNEEGPRGEIATALWEFVVEHDPDWVIDLHEGYEFNLSHNPADGKKKSVGSSVIYCGGELDPVAERIVNAANETVADPGRQFSLLQRGPVDTSLARACINCLGAEAMILETTFKDQPLSLRTRQQRAMASVLLQHIGVIDHDCRDILTAPKSSERLLVGCFDGPGTGPSRDHLWSVIEAAEDMTLHHLGSADMIPEILKQFDVVAFPGGSGSKQAKAIGEDGRRAVNEFVNSGGGYIGVCAGAFLCSANYDWSLNLINSSVFTGAREIPGKGAKQMWYRGGWADIDMEITDAGQAIFGDVSKHVEVRYSNGPIISPKDHPGLEDYRVLAWFRTENGLYEPQKGTMVDTPAIVSGVFGNGRVISVSPHPEYTERLHSIITGSIRWVADKARSRSSDAGSTVGFYKDLFVDGGARLSSRNYIHAANSLGLSYEYYAGSDETRQARIVSGHEDDSNGALLYPDGQPRFRLIYAHGGGATAHGKSLGHAGREALRSFYHNGGSYCGSCAGSFLPGLNVDSTATSRDGYLHIYPYNTLNTGMKKERVGHTIPEQSPLLKYRNFGEDLRVDDIYHNNGNWMSATEGEHLKDTEILALYDKPDKKVHDGAAIWAHKQAAESGRLVMIGSHPEGANSGEKLLLTEACLLYALDGVASPKFKGELLSDETRVMNKQTSDGDPAFTRIGDRQYHHFTIDVPADKPYVRLTLDGDGQHHLNLYLSNKGPAFRSNADFANHESQPDKELRAMLTPGKWYVSVECAASVNATAVVDRVGKYDSKYYDYGEDVSVLNGVAYSISWTTVAPGNQNGAAGQ